MRRHSRSDEGLATAPGIWVCCQCFNQTKVVTVTAEPTIFGRYQLLERIAKGGMAEVFRAKLVAAAGTEKVLCIKRILPRHSSNHEFISLFVKEAKISLSLTHGNITQVFDFGEVEGVYYLAMEYISGQDLNTVLRRVREVDALLDLPAALFLVAEVCKGLHYAHSFTDPAGKRVPVVHRDVTPHNILIAYSGEVKLTDFGIALAATKVSDEQVVRGKACYLSPEQADGSPGTVRSDIFSLGTVLYEVLTGIRPFEADSEKETLDRVRAAEVDPPSQHNPELDSELDRVVLKAMARNPDERYAQPSELQVALTQILHRRCSDYTGQRLADTVRDLFAWEIANAESGESRDSVRDRLLFQLSRAGVKVDATSTTTQELLELGTVAISGATPEPRPRPKRWFAFLGTGALVALLLGAGLAWWPREAGNTVKQRADAGNHRIRPVQDNTEHLRTPSMRQPEDDVVTPPAPNQRPVVRKVAFLNCNSWPWSVVYLNGRRLQGNTPLYRVRVAAGRHQIRFVNPELGLSKEVSVTVDPGNTKTVAVSLHQ